MNLILHNYWRSSASYRVRIGLACKDLAYEYRIVNIIKDGGAQHTDAYRAKNPMAQVPTLEVIEDVGPPVVLTQSLPILEYLDERWPQHPLLPLGASHAAMATRAKVRALAEVINAGIQSQCSTQLQASFRIDSSTLNMCEILAHTHSLE